MSFQGDVSPSSAFEMLTTDQSAVLVDVRTQAELIFVGRPDLQPIEKRLVTVEWPQPAHEQEVSVFVEGLRSVGVDSSSPVLFICRSGVRSRFAAIAAAQGGFGLTFNVAEGFEGDLDGDGHRGSRQGWKVAGLPWRQS